ncbi:uncharacterized protein LOC112691344 [Sipha flava]|uniref:Uncharacterized protein LOC112691344 n=1 Tax=Sipha flava TaxID=143950 RepID=A0A2S2QNR2_9HEMI|nr:uncharacterized protein LOC112691344 [Sipha flava]
MEVLPAAIFLTVLAIVLTDCNAYLSEAAIKKTQLMLKNVCSKKYPVDEETLTKVKSGVFPEDNNNLKCYFGCTMKTMQLINSNGLIEKQTFKDKMSMIAPPAVLSILMPAIDECAGKDKEELCQTSFNFVKCSYAVNPKTLEYLPV